MASTGRKSRCLCTRRRIRPVWPCTSAPTVRRRATASPRARSPATSALAMMPACGRSGWSGKVPRQASSRLCTRCSAAPPWRAFCASRSETEGFGQQGAAGFAGEQQGDGVLGVACVADGRRAFAGQALCIQQAFQQQGGQVALEGRQQRLAGQVGDRAYVRVGADEPQQPPDGDVQKAHGHAAVGHDGGQVHRRGAEVDFLLGEQHAQLVGAFPVAEFHRAGPVRQGAGLDHVDEREADGRRGAGQDQAVARRGRDGQARAQQSGQQAEPRQAV
ncbi:hypothetical protein CDEN61S_04214 [Castellaniella denitrificans]